MALTVLCKGAAQGNQVVVDQLACLRACAGAVGVDASDVELAEGEEFVGAGDAVLI